VSGSSALGPTSRRYLESGDIRAKDPKDKSIMGCTKLHTQRQMRDRARGQALMEFAVVAVMLATLLAGVLEFGRVWSAAQILNSAVRDGARLAAVTAQDNQRAKVVKDRVQSMASAYFDKSKVSVQVNQSTVSGQPIVTVTSTGTLNMLFGNWLLGKTVDITRAVSMRDETVAGT